MEPVAQQSFIPHEAAIAPERGRTRGRGAGDLFALVSIVLFVASTTLAAGIFLYGEYLRASETSKVDQLERAKAAFEPSLIHELTRLDDRMRAAGEILSKHIAPTTFFKMLEQTTIETVSFASLGFEASDAQNMKIEMRGLARSVNAIALQADLFSKGGMVMSPIFSDIDRRVEGVHFSLSALLNPSAINYAQVGAISAVVPVQESNAPVFGEVATSTPPEEAPLEENSTQE